MDRPVKGEGEDRFPDSAVERRSPGLHVAALRHHPLRPWDHMVPHIVPLSVTTPLDSTQMSPEVQIPVARLGVAPNTSSEARLLHSPVLPTPMSEAESQLRLDASTSGLADRVPLVSARSLV